MEPFHRDMLEEDLTYYSHKVTANTVSTPELMVRHHQGNNHPSCLSDRHGCLLMRERRVVEFSAVYMSVCLCVLVGEDPGELSTSGYFWLGFTSISYATLCTASHFLLLSVCPLSPLRGKLTQKILDPPLIRRGV